MTPTKKIWLESGQLLGQVTADIELIPIQQINEAYERVVKSDVRNRFVIDIASIKNERLS